MSLVDFTTRLGLRSHHACIYIYIYKYIYIDVYQGHLVHLLAAPLAVPGRGACRRCFTGAVGAWCSPVEAAVVSDLRQRELQEQRQTPAAGCV